MAMAVSATLTSGNDFCRMSVPAINIATRTDYVEHGAYHLSEIRIHRWLQRWEGRDVYPK